MSLFEGLALMKIIYEAQSDYNGTVRVIQHGKVLKLVVDGKPQSVNHESKTALRMVWGKMSEILKANEPDLKKLLVLGLGGGTMQHLISKSYPDVTITSVEIDPIMIDVATKFFDLAKIPNHTVINEDACRVVIEPEKYNIAPHSFDAVIVDIYCGEKYPELGKSGNFLNALKNMVRPEGLILLNRMYMTHHQADVAVFMDTLQGFFGEVQSVVVPGHTNSDNIIIFARV